MPCDEARKHEWEEPHPGRRLSCPQDKLTTWGVYAGDAGRRGSMAAKGLWPRNADFDFGFPATDDKRLGRSRTRTVPPELDLSNAGHSRPEIHTAPLPRSDAHRCDDDDAAGLFLDGSSANTPIDTPEITSETSGTESDADSFVSGPARKRQALQPLDTSFQELQFTDFSNHLTVMDTENLNSFTVAAPEAAAAFSVMSPDGDIWGWNAVLERKTTPPPLGSQEAPVPYQQRRASRSKRSLLQRVFSPGGSSADDMSSKSPTSFAGLDCEKYGR